LYGCAAIKVDELSRLGLCERAIFKFQPIPRNFEILVQNN